MKTFMLEMFTPEKQFFTGEVESVSCQTPNGSLGILGGHYPMTAALSRGEILLKIDGKWKSAYTDEGFLEVRPDEVLVFSHMCEWPEDIDEAKAKAAIERENEKLLTAASLREHQETEIELQRMMMMLRVKRHSVNIG